MQGGNDGCTYAYLSVVATPILTFIDNVISYYVFTLC